MEPIIRYYIEVLSLYGNKPQMREYLSFHGLTEEDVENYKLLFL
jgi:hypothetical protein